MTNPKVRIGARRRVARSARQRLVPVRATSRSLIPPTSRRLTVGLVLLLLALAGCVGDEPAPAAPQGRQFTVGPEGDAFYRAPNPGASARPGDLIWARTVNAPSGLRGFAILYWSTAVNGSLVAVSGVLFEPSSHSDEPRPVLAWAHGTFGLGDACAPSRGFFAGRGASMPLVRQAAREDAIFVATDYEGLGTPGEHPFMVNEAAGRNVLDSIRAAARFTQTQPAAVIMGQSQGGAAALAAARLQAVYAPEVRLRGTAAISVPSGMDQLDRQLSGGPYFGYVLMTVYGYESAYAQLAGRDADLTAAGRSAMSSIATKCIDDILDEYSGEDTAEYGASLVLDAPDFRSLLIQNDPGGAEPATPVLIVHGEEDDTIPVENAHDLNQSLCRRGANVTARFYPGAGHVDVISVALVDIIGYLRDRLAGVQPSPTCAGKP